MGGKEVVVLAGGVVAGVVGVVADVVAVRGEMMRSSNTGSRGGEVYTVRCRRVGGSEQVVCGSRSSGGFLSVWLQEIQMSLLRY
ncbi:hypothetical protein B9Z19DRAFT_352100 [Tuber borchii]|uniref:Uncharacterized protein n=1 Tax=Tuber borchii TaxID=42251 RepID=A0A2T6ZIV1_TUBBO|nr:hypothetical protein B9Z19DRAFT_352100 [Tuber borchii]